MTAANGASTSSRHVHTAWAVPQGFSLPGAAQNPDGTSYTFSDVVYVYVELHEDNTYALYQNVSAVGAVKFTGSYSLEASTIRGFYSTSAGSKAWSDSYEIGNLSGSAMTWTASHAAGDVQQFVRVETVPQEVLDASAEVRSAAVPTSGGIW